MNLTEKTLVYGGTEETVYFRELTAGEQLSLAKGQKFTTTEKDGGSFSVDLGESLEKNYRLVQMTLCDAEGKKVYPNIQKLHDEPSKKVKALVKLAMECNKDEDDAGKP